MRKGNIKRGVAALLCFCMVFGAGCGKKDEPVINKEKKTISEDDKNYVYSLSTVDDAISNERNIESFCRNGDYIYILTSEYGVVTECSVKRVSLKDGTAEDFVKLESSADCYYGNIACDDAENIYVTKNEYQESFDDEENVEDADGDVSGTVEIGDDTEKSEESAESTEASENPEDSSNETAEDSESQDDDVISEESESDEEYTVENNTLIVKVAPSGEVLWEKKLVEEDKSSNLNSLVYVKDVGVVTASQSGFAIYNPETGDGEMLEYGKRSGNEEEYYYERSLFVLRDGELYLQDNDEDWNYRISKFDKAAKVFNKIENAYPEGVYGGDQLNPGKSFDVYYMNSDAIMAYNLGDTEPTKICDLTASDLLIEYIRYIYEKDNGNLVVYASMGSDDMGLYELTKVAPEDIKDKEVLVLGTVFINDDVRKQVVKFNQLHDDYCIKIKDYFSDTYSDDMEGLEKVTEAFNLDVTSGNTPDIFVLSSYIPYESYINKGLIEPLDSYIEKDPDISLDNYLPNIMDACKRDDKLYMIIPSFYIDTMSAAKSMVGDEKVTLNNFRDICEKNNIDPTMMMGYSTRDYGYMYYSRCGSCFIDYEKGTCDFKNPAFIKLLEYIKELPATEAEDYDYSQYETMYREKKALLRSEYLSSFEDFQVSTRGYFGEEIVYNGYPTDDGGESYIVPLQQLAMSTSCANKEICWEFIKQFLSDDFQDTVKDRKWGFPISNKAFDEMCSLAQEPPFFINAEGKKELSESYYGIGDIEIKIDELSKEEAEGLASFIKSVDKVDQSNDKISEIIEEEVGAFFEGQKTAEEVADIIQSRVSIYLSENM
ncbi:ABC transporter substrate-binding protein [Butyrivibrio sp. MB2005]|uniref:ABC transporter substrate-binding protein n=1 Tax=Butyrivibrio sp. MB2005 TaxID=1280678 RepID=UPI00041E0C5D|nr:extracellular solute-binding protein [Butyrivibrio sp. MB2005]